MVCSRYPKEFKYYETVLKRKCFQKLRNNVWEKKTKWILLKKADHHYRMKVLCNCINLWISYVNERYKKKIKYRAADAFYEEKFKARVLLILKRNVEQNWMMLRICRKRFEWNLKYWCWHQWKHYIQKRLKVKEIKLLADRIREKRLMVKLLYLWLFRLNEKRSLQETLFINNKMGERACAELESRLKDGRNMCMRLLASKYFCENILKRLNKRRKKINWLRALEMKSARNFLRGEEKKKIIKLNFFKRGKYVIYRNDAYKAAVMEDEIKLKAKSFKSWKIFTGKQIRKIEIEKLAVSCYEHNLKEKCVRRWKSYVLKKKHYSYQMVFIQNFYENYLLKNYLSQWFTVYKELKIRKKVAKCNLAVSFYETKLLEKSLSVLWKARETKKTREEKTQIFHEIYVKTYLNFYINLWMEKRTEKILLNILENKAAKWREDYLRELFLSTLSKKYQERMAEREETAKIIKYSNAIIVHRAFRGWCEVTQRKISEKIMSENALKFYFEKLTKKSFEKWKKLVLRQSRKKMASEYYRYVLVSRVMNHWKVFFTKRKLKIAEAWNLEQKHNLKLLKRAFEFWKNDVGTSKLKLYTAIDYYDKSKLSKAFQVWKKNVRIKTINKSRYNWNKTILNSIIVKNAIFRWYEMYSVKQNVKKKLREFKLRKEKRSLGSHFNSWHKFVEKMKSVEQNAKVYPLLRSSILIEQYLVLALEAVSNKKIFNKKEELAKKIDEKILKRRYMKKWLSFICWRRETILKYVPEERKFDSKEAVEIFIPVVKSSRRKPMIPNYLKVDFTLDNFEEDDLVSQETFRVKEPVNENLPIIGQNFASFEV